MNNWYLLSCKIGYKSTVQRIESLGIEVFRPTLLKVTPRHDCHGVRTTEQAMFPSYLFVCFDIDKVHTSSVSKIPGAVSFVRFGDTPCIVPEKIIRALRCSPHLSRDSQDRTLDCQNIHPFIQEEVNRIAGMPAGELRELAFATLMQTVNNPQI